MNLMDLVKESPSINITINITDLLIFGQNIVSQTANIIIEKHDEKVYTRTEVIEKFNVSSSTVYRWTKHGLLKSKRIGQRTFYAESEIIKLMQNEE